MPVAWVDPGLIWQFSEELGLHPVEQGLEAGWIPPGVAHSTRKQAVPGEQVGWAFGIVVDEGDGTIGVPDQMDHPQAQFPDLQDTAFLEHHVGWHRDPRSINRMGHGGGPGGCHDLGERIPMVLMLVGGDHRLQGVAGQRDQSRRFGCGIDQRLLACIPATQEVGVVVEVAHGQFVDDQLGKFAHITRAADCHSAGIH